jgi:hypothetical protein
MKIQYMLHKRLAELMALKQVYHQQLTPVNSYIEQSIFMPLNHVIEYVKLQKEWIHGYRKQIEQETISFCTELHNTMQFTVMLLFSYPAVVGYSGPCDMGSLCI